VTLTRVTNNASRNWVSVLHVSSAQLGGCIHNPFILLRTRKKTNLHKLSQHSSRNTVLLAAAFFDQVATVPVAGGHIAAVPRE